MRHGGIESVLREIQCFAYLISGRKLVKDIKLSCIRCRILRKKRLEVVMGPKHDGNLCIAPAFHTTQVDICGSFDSFSNANKRAKVKLWFVVILIPFMTSQVRPISKIVGKCNIGINISQKIHNKNDNHRILLGIY